MMRPLPGLARAGRFGRRVEALGGIEVRRVRLLAVDLERLDPVDEEDALVLRIVAEGHQPPGAAAKGDAPGIDVPLAALAGISVEAGSRFVADVDALAAGNGVAQLAKLVRAVGSGPDHQEPARRLVAHRVGVAGERDLAQRDLEVLGEGEIAGGQRRGAGGVERGGLLGLQLRIGEEERLAIDAVPAQLPLVELLRLHVLDGNAQLEQVRLVPLELPLRRHPRPAVFVGEQIAQLREGDRLPRVEQQRDQVQQALGLVHQPVWIAGPSSAHWMAATLSPGISTFFPASGPSSVPITK